MDPAFVRPSPSGSLARPGASAAGPVSDLATRLGDNPSVSSLDTAASDILSQSDSQVAGKTLMTLVAQNPKVGVRLMERMVGKDAARAATLISQQYDQADQTPAVRKLVLALFHQSAPAFNALMTEVARRPAKYDDLMRGVRFDNRRGKEDGMCVAFSRLNSGEGDAISDAAGAIDGKTDFLIGTDDIKTFLAGGGTYERLATVFQSELANAELGSAQNDQYARAALLLDGLSSDKAQGLLHAIAQRDPQCAATLIEQWSNLTQNPTGMQTVVAGVRKTMNDAGQNFEGTIKPQLSARVSRDIFPNEIGNQADVWAKQASSSAPAMASTSTADGIREQKALMSQYLKSIPAEVLAQHQESVDRLDDVLFSIATQGSSIPKAELESLQTEGKVLMQQLALWSMEGAQEKLMMAAYGATSRTDISDESRTQLQRLQGELGACHGYFSNAQALMDQAQTLLANGGSPQDIGKLMDQATAQMQFGSTMMSTTQQLIDTVQCLDLAIKYKDDQFAGGICATTYKNLVSARDQLLSARSKLQSAAKSKSPLTEDAQKSLAEHMDQAQRAYEDSVGKTHHNRQGQVQDAGFEYMKTQAGMQDFMVNAAISTATFTATTALMVALFAVAGPAGTAAGAYLGGARLFAGSARLVWGATKLTHLAVESTIFMAGHTFVIAPVVTTLDGLAHGDSFEKSSQRAAMQGPDMGDGGVGDVSHSLAWELAKTTAGLGALKSVGAGFSTAAGLLKDKYGFSSDVVQLGTSLFAETTSMAASEVAVQALQLSVSDDPVMIHRDGSYVQAEKYADLIGSEHLMHSMVGSFQTAVSFRVAGFMMKSDALKLQMTESERSLLTNTTDLAQRVKTEQTVLARTAEKIATELDGGKLSPAAAVSARESLVQVVAAQEALRVMTQSAKEGRLGNVELGYLQVGHMDATGTLVIERTVLSRSDARLYCTDATQATQLYDAIATYQKNPSEANQSAVADVLAKQTGQAPVSAELLAHALKSEIIVGDNFSYTLPAFEQRVGAQLPAGSMLVQGHNHTHAEATPSSGDYAAYARGEFATVSRFETGSETLSFSAFEGTADVGTRQAAQTTMMTPNFATDGLRLKIDHVLAPGEKVVVGRGDAGGAYLSMNTISGKHVEIQFSNGQWELRDLGSSNGTRINDGPSFNGKNRDQSGFQPIKPGDVIHMGKAEIIFEAPRFESAPALPREFTAQTTLTPKAPEPILPAQSTALSINFSESQFDSEITMSRVLGASERVILGSGAGADLARLGIAAEHAELRFHMGQWEIRDMGKPGGTSVDGIPIGLEKGFVPINPGDPIRLGKAGFIFEAPLLDASELTSPKSSVLVAEARMPETDGVGFSRSAMEPSVQFDLPGKGGGWSRTSRVHERLGYEYTRRSDAGIECAWSERAVPGASDSRARMVIQEGRALIVGSELPKGVAATDRFGDAKHRGEDYVYLNPVGITLKNGKHYEIYATFDGVSEHKRGKNDSEKLTAYVHEFLDANANRYDNETMLIQDALKSASDKLVQGYMRDPGARASGSSMALVMLDRSSGDAYFANVADCRGYVQGSDGKAIRMTNDQSHMAKLAAENTDRHGNPAPMDVDTFQALHPDHEHRSAVTNVLGRFNYKPANVTKVQLRPGSRIILTSDGAIDNVKKLGAGSRLKTSAELVNQLGDEATSTEYHDDISVIAINFAGPT